MSKAGTTKVPAAALAEAMRRVGRDSKDRLQWVLGFAQRDLGNLTPGDWENLRLELPAFATSPVVWEHLRATLDRIPLVQNSLVPALTETEITQLQGEVRGLLDRLYKHGTARIGPLSVTYQVSRQEGTPAFTMPGVLPASPGDFRSRVLQTMAELLLGYGDHLKVCEAKCGRWFVAGRPNQVYCSLRCQSRAKTRQYRERMATRKEKGPPKGQAVQIVASTKLRVTGHSRKRRER